MAGNEGYEPSAAKISKVGATLSLDDDDQGEPSLYTEFDSEGTMTPDAPATAPDTELVPCIQEGASYHRGNMVVFENGLSSSEGISAFDSPVHEHRKTTDMEPAQNNTVLLFDIDKDTSSVGTFSIKDDWTNDDLDLTSAFVPPSVSPSETNRITITEEEITADDVLCGREFTGTHHPGNLSFLELVKAIRAHHHSLGSCHKEKTKIRNMIVDQVIDSGGRFIRKTEDGRHYYLLTLERARTKASQALREKNMIGKRKKRKI